jgi:hypothetical protein
MTISGSAALPPSPRLSNGRPRANGTSVVPLIFLWPRIIPAIVEGAAPADLTVTSLSKALPYSQTQQERAISRNA